MFSKEMKGFMEHRSYEVYILSTVPERLELSSQEVAVFFPSFNDAREFKRCITAFSGKHKDCCVAQKMSKAIFGAASSRHDLLAFYSRGMMKLPSGDIMNLPFWDPAAKAWGFHYPLQNFPKLVIERLILPKEEISTLMANEGYCKWNEENHDELVMNWSIYPIACSIRK